MGKLSHSLLDLGFFSALGSTDLAVGATDIVRCRTPLMWDSNNGTVVIYDEVGRPWIMARKDALDGNTGFPPLRTTVKSLLKEHNIALGAHVPHSNDGGRFVHSILPTILPKMNLM